MRPSPVRAGRGGSIRCQECDKAAFPTEDVAKRIADAADQPMYAYLGPECGWWHVSRVNR